MHLNNSFKYDVVFRKYDEKCDRVSYMGTYVLLNLLIR